jgi:hypothetical protein
MNRGHSYFSSLRRLFHPSSPSVDDDLADLEESCRNSSFALVPSALTPSRSPSNSVIAATRALFFDRPIPLDFPSGWEKGPVTDWYNKQGAKGSTVINKTQLRKDHQHPYYHEYIIISTRSGHMYRIDRRPDPDTPFDTIMKNGCTAHDTIQEVDSTSLKELDSTSSCVVELRWQSKSEESIDLLFILSICFAIRNDKWTDRYTLQRYNCYFFSWAIITITMRKCAVCRAVFSAGKVQGGRREQLRVLEQKRKRRPELEQKLERELDLDLERGLEQGLEWGLEQGLEVELNRALVQELVRELVRGLVRVLMRGLMRGPVRRRVLVRVLVRELALELALELVQEREREWDRSRQLMRRREQKRELAREWPRQWASGWAHGLGQVPLVLGLRKNPALSRTVSSRQVDFVISLLYGLIYSDIARRA